MTDATLALSHPPLPHADSAHLARLHFSPLESWLSDTQTLTLPLHRVEEQQRGKGRELQRLLLQAHAEERGNGDVGPALLSATSLYTHRRLQRRTLRTLFGPIVIDRIGCGRDGAQSIHPLDEAMQLPARSFSYECKSIWSRAPSKAPFKNPLIAFWT